MDGKGEIASEQMYFLSQAKDGNVLKTVLETIARLVKIYLIPSS